MIKAHQMPVKYHLQLRNHYDGFRLIFGVFADKSVVNQAHPFYWPPRRLRFGVHPPLSGNPTCEYLRHIW
jgi:hypothetical protein